MALGMRTGLVAVTGGGLVNAMPDKAKPFAGAAAGVGVGYAAASILHNPNGQVAKTVTEGATKASKFLTNAIQQIKGSSAYQAIAGKASNVLAKIKGSDTYKTATTEASKAFTKAKSSDAYKKAAGYVQKGANKIANNSTFQKLVSTVKNSSVGKWVAKNPKLAAGVAVATVLIGLVTSSKSNKAEA